MRFFFRFNGLGGGTFPRDAVDQVHPLLQSVFPLPFLVRHFVAVLLVQRFGQARSEKRLVLRERFGDGGRRVLNWRGRDRFLLSLVTRRRMRLLGQPLVLRNRFARQQDGLISGRWTVVRIARARRSRSVRRGIARRRPGKARLVRRAISTIPAVVAVILIPAASATTSPASTKTAAIVGAVTRLCRDVARSGSRNRGSFRASFFRERVGLNHIRRTLRRRRQ